MNTTLEIQKGFAQAHLTTKMAPFNIRVYQTEDHKEHVVLWTADLDVTKTVLVRVHSECLTGDVLSILHCDCGQQLQKALKKIAACGGVLIYLRQEGRGIGLLEKIKSYQLQSCGRDTFEANILLGHGPDERSYGIVKKMLGDLRITHIKLLTNNPSKVSEIASLGITVTECIPLLVQANAHNRFYLETKHKKFQHFLSSSTGPYWLQFSLKQPRHILDLLACLKGKRRDPLRYIGVIMGPGSIESSMAALAGSFTPVQEVVPIFSPSASHTVAEVKMLQARWPLLQRLHLRRASLDIKTIGAFGALFPLHLHLSDADFSLVQELSFRELVKQHSILLMLDSQEGQASLMRKIESLLAHGLNSVALSGSCSAKMLALYSALKKYYKINLSLHAEVANIERAKPYLQQFLEPT